MPHILFILLFILTAIIANEEHFIIEAENTSITKILNAEERLSKEPLEETDTTKQTAVLSVIIMNILVSNEAPVVNEKSKFDQIKVEEAGPLFRYLSGKATDKEGVEKLVASFNDGADDKEYAGGIITGKSNHNKGTTVILTATDKKGDVTTETRVM